MANSPQTYPRRIPAGMVAAYNWTHADARDTSWNGNDGTLNGDASVANGLLTLDGTGDYVSAPNPSISAYPFSLSCWIATTSASAVQGVVCLADGTLSSAKYSIEVNSGDLTLRAQEFLGVADLITGPSVNDGGWHHALSVFTSSTSRSLYLDGVIVSSSSTAILFSSCDNVNVGRQGDSTPGNYYAGQVGSTRIYNRALSAQEISDIYRNERPLYIPSATATGLEAWYRWYSNANDVTGNGNDGTLNGDAAASGGVLTLDGTGDKVDCGDSGSFDFSTSDFSVSCWGKVNSTGSGQTLVNKKSSFPSDPIGGVGYSVYFETNGTFRANILNSSSVRITAVSPLGYDDGMWHHFSAVYDRSGNLILYVDGVSVATVDISSYSAEVISNAHNFYIGGYSAATGFNLNGDVGSTRIYNRLLSATEIADIYNNERGDYA